MKRITILAFTMVIALVFSACNSSSGTVSQGAEAISATETKTPQTITWIQYQTEFTDGVNSLTERYMELNPNVTINVNIDGNNYWETFKAMLGANDIPEIFMTMGYTQVKAYNEYMTDLSDQPFVDGLLDMAKPAISMDGKVWAFPYNISGEGIIYNKKIFSENGWSVPQNSTELEALCKEMKAKGIVPFTNQFKDDWLLAQLMSGAGHAYESDIQAHNQALMEGKTTFSDSESMKRFNDILDFLIEYGQEDPLSYGWNEAASSFALGKTAMMYEGDWMWSSLAAITPDMDAGMFPFLSSEDTGTCKMIVDVNGMWHVGRDTKGQQAALDLLNWVYSDPEAKEIVLNKFLVIPTFKGWEYTGSNKLAMDVVELIKQDKTFIWPSSQWVAGFYPAVGKIYQDYLTGTISKEQILPNLDKFWNEMMSTGE